MRQRARPAVRTQGLLATLVVDTAPPELRVPPINRVASRCCRSARCLLRRAGEIAEIRDRYIGVGEPGRDFQPAPEGFDLTAKIAHIHVGAPLHLGDGGLSDLQGRGQLLL